MPLCHGSISVPTCVCLSRRYAAEGANNRHRQASEIPVLGLAGGSKPSMSMALMYFLPESWHGTLKGVIYGLLSPASTELFYSWEEPRFWICSWPVTLGGNLSDLMTGGVCAELTTWLTSTMESHMEEDIHEISNWRTEELMNWTSKYSFYLDFSFPQVLLISICVSGIVTIWWCKYFCRNL